MTRRLGLKFCLFLFMTGLIAPAFAHPHVWITAKAEVVFAPDGKVTGIRHHWTFDEAYTAYVTQGLDKNGDGKLTPEELQALADENAGSLSEFEYFTALKVKGKQQAFDPPREARMSMDKPQQVALSFFLPLKAPTPVSGALAIEIDDPTFFVYFSLADQSSVTLANAPQGCVTSIAKAKALDATMQQILQDEGAIQAKPGANFSVEYSNKAIIACP